MGCIHSRCQPTSLSYGSTTIESESGTPFTKSEKNLSSVNNETSKDTCNKLKVLFISEESDEYWRNLVKCFQKKHENKLARNAHQAILHFTAFLPNCVVIDLRFSCSDTLLRIFKSINLEHHVLYIAVTKTSDNVGVPYLCPLELGFDRVVAVDDKSICLVTVVEDSYKRLPSEKDYRRKAAFSECIYVALDRSRDLVVITDHQHVLQYMNTPCTQVLGYSRDELIAKDISILHDSTEMATLHRQLERGLEWIGRIKWRTKSGDLLPLQSHALPFTPLHKIPVHYLYLIDNPLETHVFPRGSLPSIRKGSYDLKSIISEGSARRQSLAKLNNLPLEAPITKVLALLCAAQENVSPGVIQMLEQVMDILRTTELFTSHLKADNLRTDDPLTTDLISALVGLSPQSAVMPRRSSGDSDGAKSNVPTKRIRSVTISIAKELQEVLDKITFWDFDVIQVEKLTHRKPLLYTGTKIFTNFEVCKTLEIDERTLHGWLNLMERNYKLTNTYHNSTHAADVLQASALFLQHLRAKKVLEPMDEACCLIAAAAHDLGHPGRTSAFLVNSGDALAILYNDISILENHHAALAFKVTLRNQKTNIFKGLDRETYASARACIIDTILATDMYKHVEHYTKFVTAFSKNADTEPGSKVEQNEVEVNPENIKVIKRMLIKCADVSNPARPLALCKQWANRIAEEYFQQTDEEKARNLPIVMPLFDRQTCSIPKSQVGFIDYIVITMLTEWDSFIEMPEMLYHLRQNYNYWKKLVDKGINGIDEMMEQGPSTSKS